MKQKYIIFTIILVITIGGIAYYFYNSNQTKNKETEKNSNTTSEYNTAKVGTNENSNDETPSENNQSTIENILTDNFTNNTSNENTIAENTTLPNESENTATDNTSSSDEVSKNNSSSEKYPLKETEIASFSTKIYTKDSERQNNVSITCNSLNDTIVENGKTFSFCNTVGKATSSKGYQKADVFKDGEKIKALGGGNCQVSTTLYNAVLKIPELKVTERHSHSNSVPYIQEGKDAAVAYGSYDFKFVNNLRKFYKNKM